MIDLTPYMGHIYLTGNSWVPSNQPFIVLRELDNNTKNYCYVQIKILIDPERYAIVSLEGVNQCRKVTSIHDLVKQLLVGKNG